MAVPGTSRRPRHKDPVSQVFDEYDDQAVAAAQSATVDPRFLQQNRLPEPISARFAIRFVC